MAVASCYLALVVVTRVDSIFFPGQQLPVPGSSRIPMPGIDTSGQSGSQERINILVLGLDRRVSDGDIPTRTDSIFVVTVDPATKSAGILGIPRDLLVEIPHPAGYTYEERVNAVYVIGEQTDYPGGGIELMKEVLDSNFGIPVDKYVMVDFDGFERIVEALGGIEVDVPEYLYDPRYSHTELPGDYHPQEFFPGRQQMDGQTALAYARIRFTTDDLDRVQRQQRVIFAAIEKAKSGNFLGRAPQLWREYRNAIETDINDALIPGYALLADDVKDNIMAVSLGPATTPHTTSSGAQVLLADTDRVRALVEAMFTDQPLDFIDQDPAPPRPVRVQVQNGAGIDGLARDVVRYMVAQGFPLHDLTAANTIDGSIHATSEIIDIDGTNDRRAYEIARWLDIQVDHVRTATPDERQFMEANGLELIVVLGSDEDFVSLVASSMANTGG
jgi:polyisoprenyl-teichoic acid--peptidoglycan teichoic acid transferase